MPPTPPTPPAPPLSPVARLLPWLRGYGRRDARDDVLAGSTLAAYAVPSSIAYAQLAGMPVGEFGIGAMKTSKSINEVIRG